MPFRISTVSMPVTPRTPGAAALTLAMLCVMSSGRHSAMCRVTKMRSAVRGPSESGVTFRLPKPTTRMLFRALGNMLLSVIANSCANACRVLRAMLIVCGQVRVT